MTIALVDTSILVNILNLPGKADDRPAVLKELRRLQQEPADLMLPFAAILEAGRHIAQLAEGGQRRALAEAFVVQVRKAIAGDAPWTVTPMPGPIELSEWIAGFPDHAMRGLSLADVSIIELWNAQVKLWSARRVRIWSLDHHLAGYDHKP